MTKITLALILMSGSLLFGCDSAGNTKMVRKISDQDIDSAFVHLVKGEYESSKPLLERAVLAQPDDPIVLNSLGVIRAATNDCASALSAIQLAQSMSVGYRVPDVILVMSVAMRGASPIVLYAFPRFKMATSILPEGNRPSGLNDPRRAGFLSVGKSVTLDIKYFTGGLSNLDKIAEQSSLSHFIALNISALRKECASESKAK